MPYKDKEEKKRYNKEYRKKNIKRLKEYDKIYHQDKEVLARKKIYAQKPEMKAWMREYSKEYRKTIAYKKSKKESMDKPRSKLIRKRYMRKYMGIYSKKPNIRRVVYIRNKTNKAFPLLNQYCSCRKPAEVRHHTTEPYEYDKFEFMCNPCHIKLHKELKNDR